MWKITKGYLRIGEVALNLFLLNIYWLIGTLIGGVIFGVFPATASVYQVIRKRIREEHYDSKDYKTFLGIYKSEFKNANKLGWALFLMWGILFVDIRLVETIDMGILGEIVFVFLLVLMFFLALITMYTFPVFSHFEESIGECIKRSIIMSIAQPRETLKMVISAVIFLMLYYSIPGLIPVFGIVLFAYSTMKIVLVDLFFVTK